MLLFTFIKYSWRKLYYVIYFRLTIPGQMLLIHGVIVTRELENMIKCSKQREDEKLHDIDSQKVHVYLPKGLMEIINSYPYVDFTGTWS